MLSVWHALPRCTSPEFYIDQEQMTAMTRCALPRYTSPVFEDDEGHIPIKLVLF